MYFQKVVALTVICGTLVSACGGGGSSSSSSPSAVPGVATIANVAKASDGSAAFTVTAEPGSTPITGYTVTCSSSGIPTKSATASASPVLVLALENEKAYSCNATATNAVGVGAVGAAYLLTLPRASAEGIWDGYTSAGDRLVGVVLETGENWFLGFNKSNYIQNFWQGSGTSSAGKYSASNEQLFTMNDSVLSPSPAVPFAADYVASNTFAGLSFSYYFGGDTPFSTKYRIDYDKPASQNAVSGPLRGLARGVSNELAFATLNVGADGVFAGALSSDGCNFSGSITPRPSGKNIYSVTVKFESTNCAYPGVSYAGVGIPYTDLGGTSWIYLSATNSSRTKGLAMTLLR